MKIQHKNIIIFLLCIVLGSILSFLHKQGTSWDLLNYHLYNPWAFLNNRIDVDLCACGIHSYFNPIGMVPYYLLTEYLNNYPVIVAIIQGWNWSFLVFITYLISLRVIKTTSENLNILLSLIASIIGGTTAVLYMQIGLGTIGLFCFIPILLSVYFLLKNIESKYNLLLSGIFLGIGFGLKLTNGIYVFAILGSLFCFLLFNKKLKLISVFKNCLQFCFAIFIGFIVTNGFWMCVLYKNFGNPFFPLFNNIFKSDLYTHVAYHDNRYGHHRITDVLLLPFSNLFQLIKNKVDYDNAVNVVTDYPVYDMRLGLQYIAALLLVFLFNLPIFKNKEIFLLDKKLTDFLLYFFFFSYLIWVTGFSILRYFGASIILSGLFLILIFLFVGELSKKYKLCTIFFILTVLFISVSQYSSCNYQRIFFGSKVIDVENLHFKDNSTIVFTDKVMSYIALKQNKNVKYVGFNIPADGNDEMRETGEYYGKVASIMNNSSKVYVVTNRFVPDERLDEINSLLKDDLKLSGSCREINTNLSKPFNYIKEDFAIYICE